MFLKTVYINIIGKFNKNFLFKRCLHEYAKEVSKFPKKVMSKVTVFENHITGVYMFFQSDNHNFPVKMGFYIYDE